MGSALYTFHEYLIKITLCLISHSHCLKEKQIQRDLIDAKALDLNSTFRNLCTSVTM